MPVHYLLNRRIGIKVMAGMAVANPNQRIKRNVREMLLHLPQRLYAGKRGHAL